MTIPTRVSHTACDIGPNIPIAIITDLVTKKATSVSFHANKLVTLEIQAKSYAQRKKIDDDDAGQFKGCLNLIVELDISSNLLHKGCELSRFHSQRSNSLLSITNRLRRLNLSSNGLTENSLLAIMSGVDHEHVLLPFLQHLDISHNNISSIPGELHKLCPSLAHLIGTSNRLKSLTSLLQAMHYFRGKLKTVVLVNKKNGKNNNPVCCKSLYREKMVFMLGDSLHEFDNVMVTNEERSGIKQKLAQGYGIGCTDLEQQATKVISYRQKPTQQFIHDDEGDHDHNNMQVNYLRCSNANKTDGEPCDITCEKLSNLEKHVASLSALVEDQTYLTKNLLEVAKELETSAEIDNLVPTGAGKMANNSPRSNHLIDCQHNLIIANAFLRIFSVIGNKRKHTNLLLAFSRWMLYVRFASYSHNIKVLLAESKTKWRRKSEELTNRAVRDEVESSNIKLSLLEKEVNFAKNKIDELSKTVNFLEQQIQLEKGVHDRVVDQNKIVIDELKSKNQLLSTTLIEKNQEHMHLIRNQESDLNALLKDVTSAKDELEKERKRQGIVEASHSTSIKAAQDTVAAKAADLEDMRLQIIQKDAAIKQLKNGFEHVAKKAALDMSKCEHASLAERQAKELLQTQNHRIRDLEMNLECTASRKAQLETIVANQTLRITEMQNGLEMKTSTISIISSEIDNLNSSVKQKNGLIEDLKIKAKVTVDESDALRNKLNDYMNTNSRLEERNRELQYLLEDANHELRNSMIERSRNIDLGCALEKARQDSKQKEFELSASLKLMHQENATMKQNSCNLEKSVLVLEQKMNEYPNKWKLKEAKIHSIHTRETDKLKKAIKQEMNSLKISLENERLLRLEAERKASALEASQIEQKQNMQTAIEGLAKQLSR